MCFTGLLVLLLASKLVVTHNILVLSPITAPSHSNIFRPLVRALADGGHSVTHWNGLKAPDKKNDNHLLRLLYSPHLGEVNSDHRIEFSDRDSPYRLFFEIPKRTAVYCTAIYKDPIFHMLMKSNQTKYDLIIIEGVFNECVLPLVAQLNLPFIYINCFAPPPWLLDAIGSPLATDHFPHPGSNYVDRMNLWQRTFNSVTALFVAYYHRWLIMPIVDRIAYEMLGYHSMPIREIESKYLSLLMINTHFSINYQLPSAPAVVHVGGLHCVPAKPLSKELESFVDQSGDAGFIIVSFGSILRGATIPDNVRRIFLSAFARLPQRVVWKWENQSHFDDLIPANVKLLSWLPQQDLLGHPKARLFITHGGLLSNQEAVYHSVPFIVLPVFADQPINAQKAHDDGYAIRLDWDELTDEILYQAIQQILHNPKYTERMGQISSLMRDEMDRPLDRAVYWIEYVIRHQGAPHLRSPSRQLSLYQRCLVDVLLMVFVFIILIAYVLFRLFRSFYHHNQSKVPCSPVMARKLKKIN